jgi:Ran GTPase-activating protein (RanGAP) involved in mRNA processing and transport
MICKALQNEHCKLNTLNLAGNKLTDQCIPDICRALQNGHCKLTALSLAYNEGITDEGVRMLCECSLPEGQEKKKLSLYGCSLTNACIPYLRDAMKNEHSILKELTLIESASSQEDLKQLQKEKNAVRLGMRLMPSQQGIGIARSFWEVFSEGPLAFNR